METAVLMVELLRSSIPHVVAKPCLRPSPSTLLLVEASLREAIAAVAAEVEETVNANRVEIKAYTRTSVRSWT